MGGLKGGVRFLWLDAFKNRALAGFSKPHPRALNDYKKYVVQKRLLRERFLENKLTIRGD